jgi:hypothetical protein
MSHVTQKYLLSPISSADESFVRKPASFPPSLSPIMREFFNTFYVWRAVWYLPNGLRVRRFLAQHCGGFFHHIKVRHQIERKIGARLLPKSEQIREIFVLSSKERRSLFKNLISKFQNLKHIQ